MEVGIHKRGLANGLKVPCLFMIAEVSIRCQKTRRLVYDVYPRIPPQYTTDNMYTSISTRADTKLVTKIERCYKIQVTVSTAC